MNREKNIIKYLKNIKYQDINMSGFADKLGYIDVDHLNPIDIKQLEILINDEINYRPPFSNLNRFISQPATVILSSKEKYE